jgi:hypothetical protein
MPYNASAFLVLLQLGVVKGVVDMRGRGFGQAGRGAQLLGRF